MTLSSTVCPPEVFAYRIADRRHPIFDPTGAFLKGGRWNSPGRRVIYAAQTYSGAMLETLVHAGISMLPRTLASVRIEVPDALIIEHIEATAIPGWDASDLIASQGFGDQWLDEKRTAVLLVPSVVVRAHESNVLINPDHPDFAAIKPGNPEPVLWDPRLLAGR